MKCIAGTWKTLATALCAVASVAIAVQNAPAQATLPEPAEPPALAKGTVVEPFDAEGIDGKVRRVTFKSNTVVLFFLSSCPTCHRMLPLWNTAYERRPKGLEVVGVMLDQEVPGFFAATPIAFPVLRAPGRTPAERRVFSETFKIQKVPVTLRIGAGGKVEDVGSGLLDPIRLGELFRP